MQVLRWVWLQQFYAVPPEAPMRWRAAKDLLPAPQLTCTPYDVDARFSKKRETSWVGYKVHLTESCDQASPNLITDVTTTADTTMPQAIQQQLEARGLAPTEHLVDAGYVCADNLLASRKVAIDLIGPTPPEPGWRAKAGAGFAGSCFVLDWETEVANCPQGQASISWKASADPEGRPSVAFRFGSTACAACSARSAGHARCWCTNGRTTKHCTPHGSAKRRTFLRSSMPNEPALKARFRKRYA